MLIFYGIYWALAPVGTSRSLFLPGSVVFREGPWTSGSSLTVMKRTVAGHWQVYAMLLKRHKEAKEIEEQISVKYSASQTVQLQYRSVRG